MPRYSWRESALMISLPNCAASEVAKAVFPEAVGPKMVIKSYLYMFLDIILSQTYTILSL